jgi:hypothetical protein
VNGNSGTKKWLFATKELIHSSPAIGADGTVYVGTYGGNIFAVDGSSGTKKWTFSFGAGEISASPAIGPDGSVYIGSSLGVFLSVQGVGGLAQTTWPKFRGGPLNLGRAVTASAQLPRFDTVRLSAAGCTLKGQAPPGQTWDLEASVDLLNWTRLKSLTDANGTIEFNDDQAAGLPRRFYRLEVHR